MYRLLSCVFLVKNRELTCRESLDRFRGSLSCLYSPSLESADRPVWGATVNVHVLLAACHFGSARVRTDLIVEGCGAVKSNFLCSLVYVIACIVIVHFRVSS